MLPALRTVEEGVENEAPAELLGQIGCDDAQKIHLAPADGCVGDGPVSGRSGWVPGQIPGSDGQFVYLVSIRRIRIQVAFMNRFFWYGFHKRNEYLIYVPHPEFRNARFLLQYQPFLELSRFRHSLCSSLPQGSATGQSQVRNSYKNFINMGRWHG